MGGYLWINKPPTESATKQVSPRNKFQKSLSEKGAVEEVTISYLLDLDYPKLACNKYTGVSGLRVTVHS